MKAARVAASGADLELARREIPEPSEHEVLTRVEATGPSARAQTSGVSLTGRGDRAPSVACPVTSPPHTTRQREHLTV